MNAPLWLLPALPLVSGVLLTALRRAERLAPPAAILVALLTLLLAIDAAITRPPEVETELFTGIRAGLAIDGLSAVMVVTVTAILLAVLVFAAGDIRESRGRFFGLMLVFAGAMLLTVTATDLLLLLMGWELMGAMSYALIGFWWREPWRVRAANVAFVTTRAGDLGLYLAAGCALAGAKTLDLAGLTLAIGPWDDLIAAGLVLAALGKSAQLPFSFWLARAMAGPSPVSALLHSATMVAAGAYLLLRVQPLLAQTGWAAPLVAWVGALTALLLGAIAVAQRDLKQLLAASTCAQIGYMVLAAGVAATAAGVAHLVAHAAVKSLLFLCAGAWLTSLGTKNLAELHGAARRHRLVGVTFTVGALALAGLPPFSLWVTKDAVLSAVHEPALYAVGLAGALLSAMYATKAIVAVWRPPEALATGKVTFLQGLPLPVLALAAATFGIVGYPAAFTTWTRILDTTGAPPTETALALSGAMAAITVAATIAVRLRYRGRHRADSPQRKALQNWLGLQPAAEFLLWRPTLTCANALAWFDDHVVDGAVNGLARAGMACARFARTPFESDVDGAVSAVATATSRLGTLARRPQTGQAHTYLAQAAVGFVLLAVVIALVR